MRRAQVRKIFQEHRGEVARLARELERAEQTVHDVLVGRTTSAFILTAATLRAQELVAEQQREEAKRVVA